MKAAESRAVWAYSTASDTLSSRVRASAFGCAISKGSWFFFFNLKAPGCQWQSSISISNIMVKGRHKMVKQHSCNAPVLVFLTKPWENLQKDLSLSTQVFQWPHISLAFQYAWKNSKPMISPEWGQHNQIEDHTTSCGSQGSLSSHGHQGWECEVPWLFLQRLCKRWRHKWVGERL